MRGLRVAVIGATGNVGRALVAALVREGANIVAIARTPSQLQRLGGGVQSSPLDLGKESGDLHAALHGAGCVVNVAHAKYTRTIIDALPDPSVRLITLGSTRKYTRFPDQKAAEVLNAEAAHAGGVNGLILHPTMIYGGADNNISRIVRIVQWSPVAPLPHSGRALMQPIHRDDVVRCLMTAITRDVGAEPLILAGAAAVTYADLVRACGRAVGRRVRILSVPIPAMLALAQVTRFIPGIPSITGDEVRRLVEDKAFDIGPMRARLGVTPCTFEEGVARMLAAGEIAGRHVI